MSTKMVSLVYSRCIKPSKGVWASTKKAVLLRMAWAAHDDGTNCYVSKERIAAETAFSRSCIFEAIKALNEDGVIEKIGKEGVRTNYTLIVPYIEALSVAYEPKHTGISNSLHDSRGGSADGSKKCEDTVREADSNRPCTGRNPTASRTQYTGNNNNKRNAESSDRRYETKATARDITEKAVYFAKKINEGRYVPPSSLKPSEVRQMIKLGLVTAGQFRSIGFYT